MSNAGYHLVAAGASVADAMPLAARLRALSSQNNESTVDFWLRTDSHAVPRYRAMFPPDQGPNVELHIPAEHVTAYVEVFDPLVTDRNRRTPDLGVADGAGGRWLSVHGAELDTLPGLPPVPVEIEAWEVPETAIDLTPMPTEADHPVRASIEWSAFWPAGAGLPPHGKHAAVCLVVNAVDTWELTLGDPGFRLYVVTEDGGTERAAHLAAAAGLRLG